MTDIYAPTSHDGLTSEELSLYHLIMDYRATLGLPDVPLSAGLTTTAGRHVLDTRDNIWGENVTLPDGANLHSWSDAYYYSDHSLASNMWQAPMRLSTGYTDTGYEISAAGYLDIADALEGWQNSPGHNNVIANLSIWSDFTWDAIGIGVETSTDNSLDYGGRIYHVWFGDDPDAQGGPEISGTSGADTMDGTDFDDTFLSSAGADTINGGSGVDMMDYSGAGGAVQVYLNAGIVRGASGNDALSGFENLIGTDHGDRLIGDAGNNHISGGAGHDILKGKGGTDTFFGGAGNDVIRGDDGADTMHGGTGSDILLALAGADTLFGEDGRDFLYGGRDGDIAHGGAGNDEVRGNRGNDTITGGTGADDLRGGGDSDDLDGGADNDFLFGENGSDTLNGGAGNDSLTGGAGSGVMDGARDTFVFQSAGDGGGGFDRIKDFENGTDVIDLTAFGFTNFTSQVASLASAAGSDMRLDFGGGDVLYIENFAVGSFDASDVMLS